MYFKAGLKGEKFHEPITTPEGVRCRLAELILKEQDNYQCWTLEDKGNVKVLSLRTVLRSHLLTFLRTIFNFKRAWTHKGQVGKVPDDVKAELLGSQNNEITAMLVQAYLAGFELFLCI